MTSVENVPNATLNALAIIIFSPREISRFSLHTTHRMYKLVHVQNLALELLGSYEDVTYYYV
jgi:hypothetical protein